MAATYQELGAIAAKHNAFDVSTDIDIVVEDFALIEMKDVGPKEALPGLRVALTMAGMGFLIELRVSNVGVYEMMQAAYSDITNLKVTLRGA